MIFSTEVQEWFGRASQLFEQLDKLSARKYLGDEEYKNKKDFIDRPQNLFNAYAHIIYGEREDLIDLYIELGGSIPGELKVHSSSVEDLYLILKSKKGSQNSVLKLLELESAFRQMNFLQQSDLASDIMMKSSVVARAPKFSELVRVRPPFDLEIDQAAKELTGNSLKKSFGQDLDLSGLENKSTIELHQIAHVLLHLYKVDSELVNKENLSSIISADNPKDKAMRILIHCGLQKAEDAAKDPNKKAIASLLRDQLQDGRDTIFILEAAALTMSHGMMNPFRLLRLTALMPGAYRVSEVYFEAARLLGEIPDQDWNDVLRKRPGNNPARQYQTYDYFSSKIGRGDQIKEEDASLVPGR